MTPLGAKRGGWGPGLTPHSPIPPLHPPLVIHDARVHVEAVRLLLAVHVAGPSEEPKPPPHGALCRHEAVVVAVVREGHPAVLARERDVVVGGGEGWEEEDHWREGAHCLGLGYAAGVPDGVRRVYSRDVASRDFGLPM